MIDTLHDSGVNTKQHWVSRCVLRWFAATGSDDQVWAFNKETNQRFLSNVGNVACGNGHFDCDAGHGKRKTADKYWSELENHAIPILQRIRESRKLNGLKREDRFAVARFVAAINWSTHDNKADLIARHADSVRSMQRTNPIAKQLSGSPKEAEAVFAIALPMQVEGAAPQLAGMLWILRETKGQNYITSDIGVAPHTDKEHDLGRVNMGVIAPFIQHFFPLAPDLVLQIVSKDMYHELRETGQIDVDRIGAGLSLQDTDREVEAINAIQLRASERFLFATQSSDFDGVCNLLTAEEYSVFRKPFRDHKTQNQEF